MMFRVIYYMSVFFSFTLVVANESEIGTSSDQGRINGAGNYNPPFTTYPWMVAIFRNLTPPGPLTFYAVGVALNKYWVLTSGQIANYVRANAARDEIIVKFGSGDMSAACTACQTRRVVKGIQYPTYVGTTLVNNIGVIKVCPFFPTTMTYATLPATPPTITTGSSGTSLGWQSGESALRALDQAVADSAACEAGLSAAVADGNTWETNNFCASVLRRGTCGIDRGGPFVISNQVVAVLDSSSCNNLTHTDTYTKLDATYLTWIGSNTPTV